MGCFVGMPCWGVYAMDIHALSRGLQQGTAAAVGRLLTVGLWEQVASRTIVYSLRRLAKRTRNTLDDQIVDVIAEKLGVSE